MNSRLLLPVFAATLFTSAFLIFAVQPMMGKMLLPLLGGSPSVWNTAMVFFQAALLAGYAYAHLIARFLLLRVQALLHLTLLGVFTVALPLALPENLSPPEEGGQAFWQLGIMLACAGGPFFILAASAPLFQHWFASSGHDHAENPYFLYAVSNAGSMIALLGYPFAIEPLLAISEQTRWWYGGYGLLIAFTAICAALVWNGTKPHAPLANNETGSIITWRKRTTWCFLAFVPSSLMLGATTLITTDLASLPLFWIVPLAIYLITFIIAFSRKPVIGVSITRELTAYALCMVVLLFMLGGQVSLNLPMIAVHLAAFFLCALLCHGELAQSRPQPRHLTEYFLIISFGGVLGGIFNALIAPSIFHSPTEYALSLAATGFIIWIGAATKSNPRTNVILAATGITLCMLVYIIDNSALQMAAIIGLFAFLFCITTKRAAFAFVCLFALVMFHSSNWGNDKSILAQDRNYFGIVRIYEKDGARFLQHGTTNHGAQWIDKKKALIPTTYYNPDGPAGDIFEEMSHRPGAQDIAVIGLGIGSVACYSKSGRHFDFYEIDSDVVKYARDPRYFSYLSACGSPYDIILGDGRLNIAARDKKYDLIFLDAFSSDNIPTHLMTKEAFDTYFGKLKKDGIIAINISSRHFDFRPALTALSKDLGADVRFRYYAPPKKNSDGVKKLYTPSLYAVLTKSPAAEKTFVQKYGWKTHDGQKNMRVWTDDYTNILPSLFIFQR